MRVSDYLAEKAAEAGIRDVFLVVGGGAMYLDDAFGHSEKLHCTYHHNEQAAAMAAESYAREDNTPACVIVTISSIFAFSSVRRQVMILVVLAGTRCSFPLSHAIIPPLSASIRTQAFSVMSSICGQSGSSLVLG